MTPKKRNPQDVTLRNVRAAAKRLATLEKRVAALEQKIGILVQAQMGLGHQPLLLKVKTK